MIKIQYTIWLKNDYLVQDSSDLTTYLPTAAVINIKVNLLSRFPLTFLCPFVAEETIWGISDAVFMDWIINKI